MSSDLHDLETAEVMQTTILRVALILGGGLTAEFGPPESTITVFGAVLALGGMLISGAYIGESLGRLANWAKTRKYEAGHE